MKIKPYYIITALLIAFILFEQCSSNRKEKAFQEKISRLQKQNDSLMADTQKKLLQINSLNDSITIKETRISLYESRLDSLKTKRNEIPNIVDGYNDAILDSILTNHRHKY